MAASASTTLATLDNTRTAVDELLLKVLHPFILEYLIKIVAENPYQYNPQLTFLVNITRAYAACINSNLVWNIQVDKTLTFATKQPPAMLVDDVEIKDHRGRRMRGTTLTILRIVGDCDPRELKADEKHYGLVHRIQPAFATMPEEYNRQSAAWVQSYEAASEETMAPVVTAMET